MDYKLSAVKYWKAGNSKEATAKHFGVAAKRVWEWAKQEDQLQRAVNSPMRRGED